MKNIGQLIQGQSSYVPSSTSSPKPLATGSRQKSGKSKKHLTRIFWEVSARLPKEVNASSRLVFLCLVDHYNQETGKCFPSRKRIAEKTGIAVRTVDRSLEKLREVGLISWKSGHTGKANWYSIDRVKLGKFADPITTGSSGPFCQPSVTFCRSHQDNMTPQSVIEPVIETDTHRGRVENKKNPIPELSVINQTWEQDLGRPLREYELPEIISVLSSYPSDKAVAALKSAIKDEAVLIADGSLFYFKAAHVARKARGILDPKSDHSGKAAKIMTWQQMDAHAKRSGKTTGSEFDYVRLPDGMWRVRGSSEPRPKGIAR